MLPDGWQECQIDDIANIHVGRDLHEEAFSSIKSDTHPYPVYSNTVEQHGFYGFYNFAEYQGNSVTVVGRGIGLGRAFSRKSGFGAIGRLLVISPKGNIFDADYFAEYVNFCLKIHNESGGIPQLPGSTFGKYKVVLPPVIEQKKIAKILSTWDKAIETTENLLANSQQQKKALMQQLLTGEKRLKGFGGEWKNIKLEQVLDGGKRKGKIVETNENRSGIPYIGSTSFEGGFELYTSVDDAVTCMPEDILVLWDGENAGKVTTGLTGAVSSTVVRYRFKKKQADHRFIAYCLLKDNYKIRAIREGSGIPHMPGDFESWYKLKMPPTLKEQQKISGILFRSDAEIERQKEKIAYLQQEKKALMQVLLTGKKRVKV